MTGQRSLFSTRRLRDPDQVADRSLLSVTEAAALLGVSRQAVHQRIQSGSLPAEKIGSTWAIPRTAIGGAHDAQVVSIHPGELKAWAVRLGCSCGWSYPNVIWRWAATGLHRRHLREAGVDDA